MDRDGLTVMPEAAPALAGPGVLPGWWPHLRSGRADSPAGGGAFRALGSRPYRLYFLGQVASASGTFLQATALGWLVLQLTGSATALGLVLAAGSLPTLLLGPWGGVLADRFDLRMLLIGTQLASGLLAAALWVASDFGAASVGLLVAIGVASGLVSVADSPARQAFAATLVPPRDLASAISLNGVVMNSARVVGPAIAALLIATVGTTPCFAVNALSYLAVIGALVAIGSRVPTAGRPTHRGGVREGLHYAGGKPQLWLPLAMMSLVGLLAFNFGVVLPVLAQRDFGGGGGTYGLMSTVLSCGAVVGSLGAGLVHHPRRVYLATAAMVFGIGLAGMAAAPNVPTACVALALTGMAAFMFVTLTSTTLQLHATPAYRGRIMALFSFLYLGTTPIGSPLTGWITSSFGARAALLVGAAACLLAGAAAYSVRTPPAPEISQPG
jgi:MFS family permease